MFTCRACLAGTENENDLCDICDSSKCDDCGESLDESKCCPRCITDTETSYSAAVAVAFPVGR